MRLLASGFLVQLGANLANTYYDFVQGVDNDDSASQGVGDLAIAKKKVEPHEVYYGMIACYALALLNEAQHILFMDDNHVGKSLYLAGIFLSYAYTADPFSLKYKGLGNIVCNLEFGAFLMQYASFALIGTTSQNLWIFIIPVSLSIDAILHANNIRDYNTDKKAGAQTLVVLLGLDFA